MTTSLTRLPLRSDGSLGPTKCDRVGLRVSSTRVLPPEWNVAMDWVEELVKAVGVVGSGDPLCLRVRVTELELYG